MLPRRQLLFGVGNVRSEQQSNTKALVETCAADGTWSASAGKDGP